MEPFANVKFLKRQAFLFDYSASVGSIRDESKWSWYVVRLIKNIQRSLRQFYDIHKLRFLLYPSRLDVQDLNRIKQDDAGVIWLGKHG